MLVAGAAAASAAARAQAAKAAKTAAERKAFSRAVVRAFGQLKNGRDIERMELESVMAGWIGPDCCKHAAFVRIQFSVLRHLTIRTSSWVATWLHDGVW